MLTNIQISWEGAGEAPAIYPSAPPDLFAEQPLVLFGRKQDRTGGHLRLTGIAVGGNRYEKTFDLIFAETGNPALAQLWGRARIKHLMNQMFSYETKAGVEAVTDTALTYQLLSPYTAFVAVGEDVRVDRNGTQRRVQVPVELPEGVSYTGIIGSAAVHGASSAQLPPAPRSMGVVCSMSAGISPTVQRQPVTRVPRPIQLSLPQMVSSAKRAFKQLKEKALAGKLKHS